MQNQNSRLLIGLFISLAFLASCNMPSDQAPGGSNPPVEQPPQEEPTIQAEETSVPASPSEPNAPVGEEPPAGGVSESSVEPGAQNPLPPAINLENSSIDLQKWGTDTGGGGGGPGNSCGTVFKDKTEQEIILRYDNEGARKWTLCFTNFPLETALVKLSTQSGKFDTNVNLEPEFDESFYQNPEFDGVEAYGMKIDLPAQIVRDGPLKVEISAGGITSSKVFDLHTIDRVSIYQTADETYLNLVSKNSDYYWNEPHFQYQAGDQIEIIGVNLKPSTPVFVGIYGRSFFGTDLYNIRYHLVEQFEVVTDQDGEFLGTFYTSEKYSQGNYVIDYGYEPNLLFEETPLKHKTNDFEWFSIISNSPTWQPCTADYASRLRVGDTGIVSNNPPLPNNVRNDPFLFGEMIWQLQPSEHFIILDGPVCNDGWVWWYVQNNQTLTGWTSEGDAKNYWLVPDNP